MSFGDLMPSASFVGDLTPRTSFLGYLMPSVSFWAISHKRQCWGGTINGAYLLYSFYLKLFPIILFFLIKMEITCILLLEDYVCKCKFTLKASVNCVDLIS